MRIYAIGDIHGRADLLDRMHIAIAGHAVDAGSADNVIVYLGDYVDRGLQVKEAMNILAEGPPPGFTPVFLKGNHEEMLLAFLEDAAALEDWLPVGGQATLLSYGVIAPGQATDSKQADAIRQAFMDVFPKTHYDFLSQLRPFYRAGNYLFVHAGIRPGISLEKQDPKDFSWIREPFLANRKKGELRVVHGHNITSLPDILPCRIGVDTGAYATGKLSCVMLEADQTAFLTIQSDGEGYAPA